MRAILRVIKSILSYTKLSQLITANNINDVPVHLRPEYLGQQKLIIGPVPISNNMLYYLSYKEWRKHFTYIPNVVRSMFEDVYIFKRILSSVNKSGSLFSFLLSLVSLWMFERDMSQYNLNKSAFTQLFSQFYFAVVSITRYLKS